MPKTCKISIKNHEIFIKLKNTETARSIWQNLPINSKINTWGDEIYFFTPIIKCDLEKDAKDVINYGEIAYWPDGKVIAIGFGKTPISKKNEIRLASRCNIWGETDYNLKKLKDVIHGEKVFAEKC